VNDLAVHPLEVVVVVAVGGARERGAVVAAPARVAGRGTPVDRGGALGPQERRIGE
jgi:hypothetical protein